MNGVDYGHGGYPVAIVELVEQPDLRLSTTLVRCAKQDVRIGMRLRLTWIERDRHPVPVFEPAGPLDAAGAR
jgi:uncharacterized OB-fold protein